MEKDEYLIDIIHRLEHKIDKIELQVEQLTALKDRMLGIVAIATIAFTIAIEFLKNIFSVR